jgi:ABC-type lipopolysaccharide export system ATPase subunit
MFDEMTKAGSALGADPATISDRIRTLPAQGITVVLDSGKVLAEGVPAEMRKRADVRRAYTGVV